MDDLIRRVTMRLLGRIVGLVPLMVAMVGVYAESPVPLVSSVKEWMDIQTERGREEAAWERERAHMEEMMVLLEAERAVLRQRIEAHRATLDQGAEERLMWDRTRMRQEEALLGLSAGLTELEGSLLKSVGALPDSMQKEWRTRFPVGVGDVSLSERIRMALGLALEIHTTHQTVFRGQMTLRDEAGQDRRLEALFLGISQAYAVTPEGDKAAHGVWDGKEWTWRWDAGWAPSVRHAMYMQRGERGPEWVRLPVVIAPEQKESP